ncbi:MAG: hypothetical protein IIB00_04540, partial [candidate division Zixibacteria bacterium]|nr:hypothetical protein [candidate division Zixibacteria bacterium]
MQTFGESNDSSSGISRKIEALLFFGAWTIVALVSALAFYAARKNAGSLNPWTWWELIVLKLLVWYL